MSQIKGLYSKNHIPIRFCDKNYEYAFTIKCYHKKNCTTTVYQSIVEKYREAGCYLTHLTYELDRNQMLHIHGIMLIPQSVKYSKIARSIQQSYSFSYKFDNIYNSYRRSGWEAYLEKDGYDDVESDHSVKLPRRNIMKDVNRNHTRGVTIINIGDVALVH